MVLSVKKQKHKIVEQEEGQGCSRLNFVYESSRINVTKKIKICTKKIIKKANVIFKIYLSHKSISFLTRYPSDFVIQRTICIDQ